MQESIREKWRERREADRSYSILDNFNRSSKHRPAELLHLLMRSFHQYITKYNQQLRTADSSFRSLKRSRQMIITY